MKSYKQFVMEDMTGAAIGATMLALAFRAGIPAASDHRGVPIMHRVHQIRQRQLKKQAKINRRFTAVQDLIKAAKKRRNLRTPT